MLHQYLNTIHNAKSENILNAMCMAAQSLMQEYHIKIANECFDITELEFYYFNTQTHKDPYTHLHCMQLTSAQWYVHEKSIMRGGIDYTFGNDTHFGGILIRELRNQRNSSFVTGPANIRKEITHLLEIKLNDKNHSTLQNLLNNPKAIQVIKHPKKELAIKFGKRIGLTKKSICSAEEFQKKPYRFVSYIQEKRHNNKPMSIRNINDLKAIEL